MDLSKASGEGLKLVRDATRQVIPVGSIPNVTDMDLRVRAKKLTGRQMLDLSRRIGPKLAAEFVHRYVMGE